MNTPNQKLNEKLKNGELVYGSHVFCGAPILTEAMAQCGFDVLWLDMEHTAIGMESLVNNMIAARSGGTPAWVRVPWNDPVRVKPVQDMGADGIIFPYVRTAEEARLAVASCTYPPEGIRGYGPLRALDYGKITQMDFVKNRYRDCLRIVQIEHVDAVKNLREIAAVEGIDAFIVGPNDLSASIGHIGEIHHPELTQLYKEICVILSELKKPFGLSTGYDKEFLQKWVDMGATILFSGSDTSYVNDGAMATLDRFRKDFNNRPVGEPMHDPDLLARHMQFTEPEFLIYAPKYIHKESDNVHLHVVDHPQFGGLMAFWTQSTWEGAGDNHTVMATSKDGGKTWTDPKFVVGAKSIDDHNQAHWGFPVVSRSGRIYLFFYQETEYVDFSRMITGPFMGMYSDDFGETWSAPAQVPLRVTPFDKNGQIQNNCTYQIPRRFSDGKYLFGYTKFSRMTEEPKLADTRMYFARFENLDEDPEPQDLQITNLPDDEYGVRLPMETGVSCAEEPCIVELPDGRLFCTLRTAKGCVYYTVSDDNGHTWRDPEPLRFDDGSVMDHSLSPCPIFRLDDEKYAVLYHGEKPGADVYFPRNPLMRAYGYYAAADHQPIRFPAGTAQLYMKLPEPEARDLGQFGLAMYACHVKVDGRDILWYPDRKCFLLGKEL